VYGVIGVEYVCVVHIANLCFTRLGMMHLTLTYEIRGSQIIQRILEE
jgi:hypothetical protein